MSSRFRFSDKFSMAVATIFGIGKMPIAPGTWASIFATFFIFIPIAYRRDILMSFIIVFTIISVNIINRIEKVYGNDPKFVVIDEAIGMWIVMLSSIFYYNIYYTIFGFAIFRVLDIFKPYPISLLDKRKGGIYVLLDDILAGIFSVLLLNLVYEVTK